MGDRDETPHGRRPRPPGALDADTWRQKRPRSEWGDEQRAAVGGQHRQREAQQIAVPSEAMSESQRQRDLRQYVQGSPLQPPRQREPITDTFELLESDLSPVGLEVVNRSARNSDSPVVYKDLVNLGEAFIRSETERKRRAAETESQNQQQIKQLDEILASPREIQARLAKVEFVIKTAQRLIVAAVLTLGGYIGVIASGLLNHHDAAVTDAVRTQQQLEQCSKGLDRHETEIRDMRLQLGRRPDFDHSGKGPTP